MEHVMTLPLEYAGGISDAAFSSDKRLKTRNAPQWWLRLADCGLRSAAMEKHDHARPGRVKPTPSASPRWAGWIAGVACAGVSEPAYSPADRLTLREQFTDDALAAIVKQLRHEVPLRWGHNGPTLCSTRGLDMILTVRPLMGLTFTARLRDTDQNRRVMRDIGEDEVIGVSIGFTGARGWKVERDGIGTVRIVNSATIDHVALLPRGSGLKPAYAAAWAAASVGHRDLCPSATRTKAELRAYAELKRQAGCRS
jgi:phage head maturation protease